MPGLKCDCGKGVLLGSDPFANAAGSWHHGVMRTMPLILGASLFLGCGAAHERPMPSGGSEIAVAEAFIDSFYSFDPAKLRAALDTAPSSKDQILYYQGWAEGGNYRIVERKPCVRVSPGEVRCDITVKDDLIGALRTGFDVTDSFHLGFVDGRIVKVKTTSNDPPQMEDAFKWLRREQPQIWDGPCKGFYAGGPTPQDCTRAIVRGFGDYTVRTKE